MTGDAPLPSDRPDRLARARRIRDARETLGLSQADAAAAVGRSQKWWSNLESGRLDARGVDLARVADLLRITLEVEDRSAPGLRERLLAAAADLPREIPAFATLTEALGGGEPTGRVFLPGPLALDGGVELVAAPLPDDVPALDLRRGDLVVVALGPAVSAPLAVTGTRTRPTLEIHPADRRQVIAAVVAAWRPFVAERANSHR